MRNATRNGRRKRMTIETNGRRKRMTIETLAADWFPERPRGMHLPLKFQTETLLEVRPPNSPRSRRYLMARAPRAREIRTFPHGNASFQAVCASFCGCPAEVMAQSECYVMT
jgi:hypothetical protein